MPGHAGREGLILPSASLRLPCAGRGGTDALPPALAVAEKAKEQASQLGEAAFSGAGNIAAATGLVKKEEFPADLKVSPAPSGTALPTPGTPRPPAQRGAPQGHPQPRRMDAVAPPAPCRKVRS